MHVSDLLVQEIMGSKFYWQNLPMKAAIGVIDEEVFNDNSSVAIYFYQAEPYAKFFLTNELDLENTLVSSSQETIGYRVFRTSKSFQRRNGKIVRPDTDNKILNRIFDLIDEKSWSFPRAATDRTYLPGKLCAARENYMSRYVQHLLEKKPYCILTVDKAGTLLAQRMGVHSDGHTIISHYNENNTQDDSLTSNIRIGTDDSIVGADVLVIDDLISSGRTAKTVSEFLINRGAASVTWIALYRTVSSNEVSLVSDGKIRYKSFFPLSNAFWVWGRGFDLTTEESRQTSDIYASQKHWDDETLEDIFEVIQFFGGSTAMGTYIDALTEG